MAGDPSSPDLADLRREYPGAGLEPADLDPDPLVAFRTWLDAAVAAGGPEPNAMTLATATAHGRPSARIVLLKGVDGGGFVFFTNYTSRKAAELAANPAAALVWFWPQLHRQVCAVGTAHRVTPAESEAYFASRPRGSQLGAHASDQSRVIDSRALLEQRLAQLHRTYQARPVPRPQHWGGMRVVPDTVEFWQGRPDRLHDRLRYRRSGRSWVVERLAP